MVGWRIGSSNINDEWKYPIILPEKSQISKIIVLWCHKKTEHSKRGMVLKEIQNSGYWIIANSITSAFISQCVRCRSFRGHFDNPFGFFTLREKRKELERYDVTLIRLLTSAIYLEITYSLKTDSICLH